MLGARCGKASKFAVLDIDQGSSYHNAEGYRAISALLRGAGIENFGLYRSSSSGGWHIYIFFDAPVSSRDLYKQLFKLFSLNGLEIAKGKLELFPNPGDESNGQGLRLPLQPGFAWLSDHSQEVLEERDEISPTQAVMQFVRDIECNTNSHHDFHKLRATVEKLEASLPRKVSVGDNVVPLRLRATSGASAEAEQVVMSIFGKVPQGMICESWVRGRNYYQHGLAAAGQRADAVFTLGHFLFYGDPKAGLEAIGYKRDDERRKEIEDVLAQKHHGYSKDISAGRAEARKHIERATAWVPPHRRGSEDKPYEPLVPISWIRNNENRAIKAQKKIAAAVEDFQEAGMCFSTRDLALKSGVSPRTINKYPELWKDAQDGLRAGRFATAIHEYNAVGEVLSSNGVSHGVFEAEIANSDQFVGVEVSFDFEDLFSEAEAYFDDRAKSPSEPAYDIWLARVRAAIGKRSPRTSERGLREIHWLLSREFLTAPGRTDRFWLLSYLSALKARILSRGAPVQLNLIPLAAVS